MRTGRLLLILLLSCKGSGTKIDAMRDGLTLDELGAVREATEGFPVCQEPFSALPERGCFREIAMAFGSKSGFNDNPPDQAAAATAALILVRERRGDWFRGADVWLASMKSGKGAGADSLRLAVARQMTAAAPEVGKKLDDERGALPVLNAIGSAIPGACATYTALANGIPTTAMPPEMTPDHSACVQKDLARKDGPGGTYGRGTWRAAEGAVALWKDAAGALREGLAAMGGKPRATVEVNLKTIDEATRKIDLKKVPRHEAWLQTLANSHGDAGVPFDAEPPKQK